MNLLNNVSHIIKTKSLKSDGRLLKWILSLNEFNISSHVFVLEDDNQCQTYAEGGAKIVSTTLVSRTFFGKRKGYLFKVPEFSIKSISFYKRSKSEIFIFHDVQHYFTLFLICLFKSKNSKKKIVWDLHELPHPLLSKTYLSRKIIKLILEKIDLVVYTNEDRRAHILKKFTFKEPTKAILNNFPNSAYHEAPIARLPSEISTWLNGSPYLLWMGAASPSRNFLTVLNVMELFRNQFKLVVMGSITEEFKVLIESKKMQDVIYSKFVNQSEIINYVDNALFSVVLYKQNSENNTICEPNRLYQLITRRIPVIVGNNPPMKHAVERTGAGIVLSDDGSDEKILADAIARMMKPEFRRAISVALHKNVSVDSFNWDNQFQDIYEKLLSIR